jgi:hypothetical protein
MPREWRDEPPARRVRKYDWPAIVAQLQTQPDKWALIDKDASPGLQAAIRRKRMTALRSDEWEYEVSTHTNSETGGIEVWMSAVRKDEHGE